MNEQKTLDDVIDLISKQKVGMLTTHEGDRLVSRPMGMQDPDRDGTLWFFAKADSDVAHQVGADPRVNVSLADGDYLSVTGTAAVVNDVAKKRELWDASVEAFMQTDPEDPQAVLIKVAADSIAYWDTPSAVGSVFAMVKGLVGDSEPDAGDSGVVEAGR